METNKVYQFSVEDAVQFGIEAAVLLQNFRFWLDKNEANESHIFENRVWTYNSTTAFEKLYPFMTKGQIRGALKRLEEAGKIIVGNFSTNLFDRTNWYTVNEPKYQKTGLKPNKIRCAENNTSMVRNLHIDGSEFTNRHTENNTSMVQNSQMYIGTYDKQTDKSVAPATKAATPSMNVDDLSLNQNRSKKQFVPPNFEEVAAYFAENGFTRDSALRAFKYYDAGKWFDSNGKKVRNWKQKMQSVWFKPEHKTKPINTNDLSGQRISRNPVVL